MRCMSIGLNRDAMCCAASVAMLSRFVVLSSLSATRPQLSPPPSRHAALPAMRALMLRKLCRWLAHGEIFNTVSLCGTPATRGPMLPFSLTKWLGMTLEVVLLCGLSPQPTYYLQLTHGTKFPGLLSG